MSQYNVFMLKFVTINRQITTRHLAIQSVMVHWFRWQHKTALFMSRKTGHGHGNGLSGTFDHPSHLEVTQVYIKVQ